MAANYEPNVLLVVAGGTICMQTSPEGLTPSKVFVSACLSPQPTFNDGTPCPVTTITNEHGKSHEAPVLRLPQDRSGANVRCTVLEFNPLLDSSNAHAPTWLQLARCILSNAESFDAFVICHGTDTLAYSAAALSFLLRPTNLTKTVVLTGAQRSMFFPDSDGAENLLGSIVLASQVRIPEVCVYFARKLLRATRITKVSAENYAGFESPNAPPLATVRDEGIVVHWDNLLPPLPSSPSILSTPPSPSSPSSLIPSSLLPTLDTTTTHILKIHPGLTPTLLSSILSTLPPISGLILETFGAGNLPSTLIPPLLSAARDRDVVLVAVTQCLHGAVSAAYAPGKALAGGDGEEKLVVFAGDMTTEAAFVKLVYLLGVCGVDDNGIRRGRRETAREVRRRFGRVVAGEMTLRVGGEDGKGRASLAMLPIRYERTVERRWGRESRL